jgi:NTP pyrophosphatase (non-canonical NTP hydrolase)
MELTQEQQQALQNLTKVFSLTASKEAFNNFFKDELADLKHLEQRQEEINDELKDLMQYADMGAKNVVDIMEEFSINERDMRRIDNRLQMARGLLLALGVNLV